MRLEDIKPGDKLIADDAFPCLGDGQVCEVHRDDDGDLFVYCRGPDGTESPEGKAKHSLDGQVGEDGEIIGFSRAA